MTYQIVPFDSDLDTLALAQAVLSAIQAANKPPRTRGPNKPKPALVTQPA